MAEERIYITEVKEGDVCPFEENCEGFYKLCEGCNVLPTRQEVIERMAKAIFKRDSVLALDIEFENLIEQKQNVYRDFAEIALNALLEGYDNER